MDASGIGKLAVYRSAAVLIVFFVVLLLMSSISSTFNSSYNRCSSRVEVKLKVDSLQTGGRLMYVDDVAGLKTKYLEKGLCYISGIDTNAISGRSESVVEAVLAKSNFPYFSDIKLVKGSFFSEDAEQYGRNNVVISRNLAAALFSSYDIIGVDIYLFGTQKYMITGIYDGEKSVLSLLGSDGRERVYIPFESYRDYRKLPVQTLIISDEALEGKKFRNKTIAADMEEKMKIDASLYDIKDYYDSGAIVSQYVLFVLFIMGICSICILILLMSGGFARMYLQLKSKLSDRYFYEILKSEKIWFIKHLIFFAANSGLIAAIFLLVRFKPYIPAEYIPQENLFDLAFYAGKIKSAIYTANSFQGYTPDLFDAFYESTLKLETILFALAIPIFILLISEIKLLKLTDRSMVGIFKLLLIASVSAVCIYFAMALLCGMNIVVPGRELLVMVLFVFLLCMRFTIHSDHGLREANHSGLPTASYICRFKNKG